MFTVHWPNKTLTLCSKCTDRALNVASTLGFQLSYESLKTTFDMGECKGCMRTVLSNEFTNAISLSEFHISGLCQTCQKGIMP